MGSRVPLKGLGSRVPLKGVESRVPFWCYLLGSLIQKWLNQKKGSTMETLGRVWRFRVLGCRAYFDLGFREFGFMA